MSHKSEVEISSTDPGRLDIKLKGEFANSGIPDVKEKIFQAVESFKNGLVSVDLTGVTYLDSIGVTTFVDMYHKVKARNARLEILNPSDEIRKVFKLAQVDRLLNVR